MEDKGTSILKAFYHIKHAQEQFLDFMRDYPEVRIIPILRGYVKKLEWIERDFRTLPSMPDAVSDGMREELSGDILFPTAIAEKCLMLSEDQKEAVEYLLDRMIAGEKLEILKLEILKSE